MRVLVLVIATLFSAVFANAETTSDSDMFCVAVYTGDTRFIETAMEVSIRDSNLFEVKSITLERAKNVVVKIVGKNDMFEDLKLTYTMQQGCDDGAPEIIKVKKN